MSFFKSDDGQIKYRRDTSANTMPSWLSLDGDQWYISGRPLLSDVGVHEGIELTFRFRADSGPGIDKMYFSPVSVFTIEVFDDPTKQPPSLTLRGEELEGDTSRDLTYTDYSDGSFTISAEDPQDGGITDKIIKTGSVDRNIPWLYPVTYSVTDSDGNVSTATLKVRVMASDYNYVPTISDVDSVAPVITLTGSASVSLEAGATYADAGATSDGGETVTTTGIVDPNTVGVYTLTYSANDAAGNAAEAVVRTVNVVNALQQGEEGTDSSTVQENFGDVVVYANNSTTLIGQVAINGTLAKEGDVVAFFVGDELRGKQEVNIDANGDYSAAGTAWVNAQVHSAGGVEQATVRVYEASTGITYDKVGLSVEIKPEGKAGAFAEPLLIQMDNVAPELTLLGEAQMTIDQGTTYADAGASATDNVDGDLTSKIVVTGAVDTSTAGTYTLKYDVK